MAGSRLFGKPADENGGFTTLRSGSRHPSLITRPLDGRVLPGPPAIRSMGVVPHPKGAQMGADGAPAAFVPGWIETHDG